MTNGDAGLILPESVRNEIRDEAKRIAAHEVRSTVDAWVARIGRFAKILGGVSAVGILGFFGWLFFWAPELAAKSIRTQIESSDRFEEMQAKVIEARADKLTEIGTL